MIQQKSHLKTHIEKQHPGKKGLLKKALANHNKVKDTKYKYIQMHLVGFV